MPLTPVRSDRTQPCRCAASALRTTRCEPFRTVPGPSTSPTLPFSIRQTATSAFAPTLRWPSASCRTARAAFHVVRRTISSNGRPSARNLLITFGMSFMPPLMLATCRSVEMTSGRNPSLMAGTAMRHAKLVAPWPTSNRTPRFLRLPEGRIDLAGRVLLAAQPRVHVRVDVARTQLARDELGERTLGLARAEVDHHRQRRQRAGFDGAFHGRPLGS